MSTIKRVTRNSFYLVVSRVIGILFTMILGVYAARKLGDAGYGRYSFIVAFIAYFMVFSSSELQNVIVREVAQKKQRANEFLSAGLILKLLGSIISVGLILLITQISNKLDLLAPILIAGCALIPLSVHDSFDAILRGHERMGFIALTNIFYSSIKMLVGLILLSRGLGLVALFSGFFFVEIARALLLGLLYHFNVKPLEWVFHFFNLRYLFGESYILAIKGIIGIIYYKIDIFLLALLTSDAEVGWYAAAVNIIGLGMMVLVVGSGAVFPVMSQFFINSKDQLVKLYQLINKYIYVALLPLVLIIMAWAKPIVRIIYGSQYQIAGTVLSVGIWSVIPVAVLTLQGMVILISGEYKRMMRLYLVVDSFKVVLSIFLIRQYGLIGAVVAMVTVDALATLIYQQYVAKHLEKLNLAESVRQPILGLALIALAAIFISHNFPINLSTIVPVAVASYLIFIFRSGVVSAEEINYFKRIFR